MLLLRSIPYLPFALFWVFPDLLRWVFLQELACLIGVKIMCINVPLPGAYNERMSKLEGAWQGRWTIRKARAECRGQVIAEQQNARGG